MKNFILITAMLAAAGIVNSKLKPGHSIRGYAESVTGRTKILVSDTMRLDPVCGMKVDDARADTVHDDNTVYGFCSPSCKTDFLKNPKIYLPKKKKH